MVKKIWCMLVMLAMSSLFVWADEIHDATLAGDLVKVKALIEKNPALLNLKGRRDKQPIHCAAQGGHINVVEYLLGKGADINSRNDINETPLVYAADTGNLEMATFLVHKKADLNVLVGRGDRALTYAIVGRHTNVALFLIKSGADVHYKDENGFTVLHMAALGDSLPLVQILLDKGLEVTARERTGFTPLHLAARGTKAIVELLLKKGADVNASTDYGMCPLHMAASDGDKDIIELLIKKGAAVNAINKEGMRPLFLAAKEGKADAVNILLAAGATVDTIEKDTQRSALHYACAKGYGAIAAMLLQKGINVNAADGSGATALDLANRYGQSKMVTLLTAKGAIKGKATATGVDSDRLHAPLPAGQALVWYLGHSGWAIKTQNHFLVFDYWKDGAKPDEIVLVSGAVDPHELKDMNVTVFVSHGHNDHYMPEIFNWKKTIPAITYVMGFAPEGKIGYSVLKNHENTSLNGMEITPIESNDSGQGFFVVVDGVKLYYPGDHTNRNRDFSGSFKKEIDFLADAGLKADITFAPVSGCGFGDIVAVKKGVLYTIDRLAARVVFPMHAGGNEMEYTAFARDAKNAGYEIPICCAEFPGDHFMVSAEGVRWASVKLPECGNKDASGACRLNR